MCVDEKAVTRALARAASFSRNYLCHRQAALIRVVKPACTVVRALEWARALSLLLLLYIRTRTE